MFVDPCPWPALARVARAVTSRHTLGIDRRADGAVYPVGTPAFYFVPCPPNERLLRARRPRCPRRQVRPAAESRESALGRGTPTGDQLPGGYAAFFAELSARMRAAQLKAAVAVNRELIALYWDLGREIVTRQDRDGWGTGVIVRLSADLRREFPAFEAFQSGMSGAPARFTWPTARVPGNRQQAVAEMDTAPPTAVAAIPWGHNLLLLEKLADPALRLSYAEQTTAHGWSRSMLGLQIETALHTRLGRADQTTNFAAMLPPPQSDLARAVVKDPYNFEFLTIAQDAHERHVEAGLVAHMRQFLLELGTGFLYAGNQYRLIVGGEEFFLDLLFYHTRLRCWVVLDIKMREFTPESAGKMHFYLERGRRPAARRR